jgi:magnesium-transporting ATPase (P-type)
MPCDAVLIQGDAYMNEESLTGESVPVAKLIVQELKKDLPDKYILFEGTMNI